MLIHTITIKVYDPDRKMFTDVIGNRVTKLMKKDKVTMKNATKIIIDWKNNYEK